MLDTESCQNCIRCERNKEYSLFILPAQSQHHCMSLLFRHFDYQYTHIVLEVDMFEFSSSAYVPDYHLTVLLCRSCIQSQFIFRQGYCADLRVHTENCVVQFQEFLMVLTFVLVWSHYEQVAARKADQLVFQVVQNVVSLVKGISPDNVIRFQFQLACLIDIILSYKVRLFHFELIFTVKFAFVKVLSFWENVFQPIVNFLNCESFIVNVGERVELCIFITYWLFNTFSDSSES